MLQKSMALEDSNKINLLLKAIERQQLLRNRDYLMKKLSLSRLLSRTVIKKTKSLLLKMMELERTQLLKA